MHHAEFLWIPQNHVFLLTLSKYLTKVLRVSQSKSCENINKWELINNGLLVMMYASSNFFGMI